MRHLISLLALMLFSSILMVAHAQKNAKLISFYDKWPYIQDRQGYIWYADYSGKIGKYLDGDRSADAEIFDEFSGCDYINIIKEDIEGQIWIATGCRFYRFDPVKKKFEDILQQIQKQAKITQAHTESWYQDTSGTVWFGGTSLISYTLKTKKIIEHQKASVGFFFNLFGGPGNNIWFSNPSGKGFNFTHYDPVTKKTIRSINFDIRDLNIGGWMSASVKTEKIFEGSPETYLVYLGAKVLKFDSKAETFTIIPVPGEFGKVTEIGNDGLYNYIGTNNGTILLYQPVTNDFKFIWQHPEKKPVEIIFPSSKGKGVYAYADNNLIPISTSPPLLNSILDLKDTMLRKNPSFNFTTIHGRSFMTANDHLVSLHKNYKPDNIIFDPALPYPKDMQYFVSEIPGSNQFWQLIRYFPYAQRNIKPQLILRDSSGKLLNTYHSPLLDTLIRSSVKEIITDRCKNVWIATHNGLIAQFNSTKNEFKWIITKPVTSITSPRISVDSKCNLWISNSSSGLVCYNSRTGTFKEFHPDESDTNSISSDHVTYAYEAGKGDIWVGTKNKGISIMDSKTGHFRHLNKRNGLPELIISDIAEDKKGVVWVATLQYLCRWVPEENRFVVYRNEDGIAFNTAFIQKVFYPENDSMMMVRTADELMSFDPGVFQTYKYAVPALLFTGFSIGNKPVVVGAADSILPVAVNFIDKINLRYVQNKFTIQYAAVDFYGNLQYAYRLSGFEDDWQYVKNKTEAIYTNVPPGDYVFEVKVANHQGYWSESREIPVTVKAPWYRTWLAYIIYALVFAVLLRLYLRFRSRKLIQQNLKLEDRISKRTNELSDSLRELKETQDQLVQREKMASLGELTAGIAHEIQNPLNFVNNFSEINTELIDEADNEMNKGNISDAKIILNEIKENEQKIVHHGKRADAIVKGMLQHSRISNGQKELTNINALADEYLRLAYHGLRAKDKSFNATLKTDFDTNIHKINIIPQDIGRVILNLITNAFYAIDKKKKDCQAELVEASYEPTVSLSTKKVGDKVEIKVADNGHGIPQKIIDKIFQPFFTTKPTGQGTGLGLSLSYDIIKAHGGELRVETKEGEGSTFIISIPSN